MMTKRCGTCMYFERAGVSLPVVGACHYNPPATLVVHQLVAVPSPRGLEQQVQERVDGFWPPVGANQWCGQWQAGEISDQPEPDEAEPARATTQ